MNITINEHYKLILAKQIDVLVRKNQDYGGENISVTGVHGVLVRMIDKVFRIKNLIRDGAKPNFESLQDSIADTLNYALITILLLDKKWGNSDLCTHANKAIEGLFPFFIAEMSSTTMLSRLHGMVFVMYQWVTRNPTSATHVDRMVRENMTNVIRLCLLVLVDLEGRNAADNKPEDKPRSDQGKDLEIRREGTDDGQTRPPVDRWMGMDLYMLDSHGKPQDEE